MIQHGRSKIHVTEDAEILIYKTGPTERIGTMQPNTTATPPETHTSAGRGINDNTLAADLMNC